MDDTLYHWNIYTIATYHMDYRLFTLAHTHVHRSKEFDSANQKVNTLHSKVSEKSETIKGLRKQLKRTSDRIDKKVKKVDELKENNNNVSLKKLF